MSLRARLHAIVLLAVLALFGAMWWLTEHSGQAQQQAMQDQRDGHLLRKLRTTAENHLATGLQIDQLEALQQVITRDFTDFAGLVAIDVFSAGGTVLYSTDAGNRSMPAPEGWRENLAQDGAWELESPGQRQIGQRFDNDLGQAAGGVVVTFSTATPAPSLAQWSERGRRALQWLGWLLGSMVAAMVLLHLGLHHVLGPYRGAARILRGAQSAPNPAGVVLWEAAAQQRVRWGADLQRQQQGMQQLEALDHEA
jgi:hypothetical protein